MDNVSRSCSRAGGRRCPQKKGSPHIFAHDEGMRPDSSVELLAKLKSVLKNGAVRAGNASRKNEAAAACLVVAEDKLNALNLTSMGFLKEWAVGGCNPSSDAARATMGLRGCASAAARTWRRSSCANDLPPIMNAVSNQLRCPAHWDHALLRLIFCMNPCSRN